MIAATGFGAKPSESELDRLVSYYPKYLLAHRQAILRGYAKNHNERQLVDAMLLVAGKDPIVADAKSRGGYGRSVQAKLHRIELRLHYLHLRIDQGMTKRRANAEIQSHARTHSKDMWIRQNAISRITRCAKLK